jgi:hypothetical protein
MSALGPKRTSLIAPHMFAFGVRADMAFCGISLSRSLLGVKRMSAYDPKRTSVGCAGAFPTTGLSRYDASS